MRPDPDPRPLPPRPPAETTSAPGGLRKRVLAGAFVAALGAALALVAGLDRDPADAPVGGTPVAPSPRPASRPASRPAPSTRPATSTRPTSDVARRAVLDGVAVEYRYPPDVSAAYRQVAPDDGVAGTGAAACAAGRREERSWVWPADPARAAGRYHCTWEAGRAVMWWTVVDEGLLAHAVARDDDLAALFAWWLRGGGGP